MSSAGRYDFRTGDLRYRLTLQEKIATRDVIGGEIVAWIDVAMVWGDVDAISGREANIANQLRAVVTLRVVIRRREGVDPTMRVLWNGDPLNIEEVVPPDPQDSFMVLLCSRGLRDG